MDTLGRASVLGDGCMTNNSDGPVLTAGDRGDCRDPDVWRSHSGDSANFPGPLN